MKNSQIFFVFSVILLFVFSAGKDINSANLGDDTVQYLRVDTIIYNSTALKSLLPIHRDIPPVSWWIDTVDIEGNTGRYTSVAIDSQGCPHISYCREDNAGYVKYAHWNGCAWDVVTLDEGSGGDNGNVLTTAIVLDDQDRPFIAYAKPPGEVKCVYWDGDKWASDIVYSGDGVYGSVGIGLDSNQHPHISYSDGYGSRRMRYGYWDGTLWHNEVVDVEGIGGVHNSLIIDSNDFPHIAYTDVPHRTIKYAMRTGEGTWQVETVDTGEKKYLLYPTLDIDGDSHPHIGYYDTSNYDLKYAYKGANEGWHIQTIISKENVCYSSSLALDSQDIPHFICQNIDSKDLLYLYLHGDTWISETVDYEGAVGCCSDIVLDAYDCVCISYRDEESGNLKFARSQVFSINISDPQPGIYLNNKKIIACPIPIAIGKIDISLEILDKKNEITYLQIYINGKEKARLDEIPYTWQFEEPTFGKCSIVAVAHDVSGNYGIQKTTLWKFF